MERPWVKFVQAYTFTSFYVNPKFVATVCRHTVWDQTWTVITTSNETYTVLEPIESVLEKLGIKEQRYNNIR